MNHVAGALLWLRPKPYGLDRVIGVLVRHRDAGGPDGGLAGALVVDRRSDGGDARVLAVLDAGEGWAQVAAVVADYLPRARAYGPQGRRLRATDFAAVERAAEERPPWRQEPAGQLALLAPAA